MKYDDDLVMSALEDMGLWDMQGNQPQQFAFDDPTKELSRLGVGQSQPFPSFAGTEPPLSPEMMSNPDQMQALSQLSNPNQPMTHQASNVPYDPLDQYDLTNEDWLMDIMFGGSTAKQKHATAMGEPDPLTGGLREDIYDPAIDTAFMGGIGDYGIGKGLQMAGKGYGKLAGMAVNDAVTNPASPLRGLQQFIEPRAGIKPDDPIASIVDDIADSLPMDEASRMQRAQDMGFDYDVFHATTHDIDEFDLSKANPESDMGGGIYTSTSVDDASANYSDLTGQDLTQRIEQRAERISSDKDIEMDEAMALARGELYGEAPNVMPLKGRMDNPLNIGGDNATRLTYEREIRDTDEYMDEAKLEFEKDDYDDISDYNGDVRDRARDMAVEDSYNFDPEGQVVDLTEALRYNDFDVDASESIDKIMELAYEADGEGISADDILDILKSDYNLMDAYTDAGDSAGNEVIRKAFEDAGFDGVIDRGVNSKWGYGSGRVNFMEGIEDDTAHYVFFKPNQLRSKFAKFDPKDETSANLLKGMAGLTLGAGLMEDNNRN